MVLIVFLLIGFQLKSFLVFCGYFTWQVILRFSMHAIDTHMGLTFLKMIKNSLFLVDF